MKRPVREALEEPNGLLSRVSADLTVTADQSRVAVEQIATAIG